ncbi:CLUMA_CG004031, isoform A [Clunio marinus]|uniref:CLUMA_CG004031, isoform A n=1 Tax=Clunio marinus TaxID=568069 RepID=A0A1J1HQW8_9DIPT|nr:CLUMA_CG004031, isoform A [Clunio marinus]
MTQQSAYLKTLLYVCKLRYPRFPSHYFPVYLIAKFVQEFQFRFHIRQLNFQLRSIPNRYFDFLCRNHEIQSDHTIFINQKVFDYYIYQKDVNFLNLTVSDATKKSKKLSAAEKVVKKILDSPENSSKSNKVLAVYQVFPLDGIPINKIFIKENSFWNFMDRYKLSSDHEQVYVNMSMLAATQKLPTISTKANIFLVNSPYDVSSTFVDDVLSEYFKKPRLLYRNHTYRLDLTEDELGNFIFCENFELITKLKRIYFKCVHLESRGSSFDLAGIVVRNLTSLHQMTTINYQVPKVTFGDHFITNYPSGLNNVYESLKSSLMPFVASSEASKSMLKARKIFPIIQLMGERGSGKRKVLQSVADSLGIHLHFAECCDIVTSIPTQTEQKILYTLHRATNCQPVILCFNDFEFFGKNNEGHEDDRVINFFRVELEKLFTKHNFDNPIIIVALVNSNQPLKSKKISGLFLETIAIHPMEKEERFRSLLWYHQREYFDRLCYAIKIGKIENYININIFKYVDQKDLQILRSIAEQTQGFILGDLRVLYQKSIDDFSDDPRNFQLNEDTFKKQLAEIKKCFSDSIGTPEIPRVKWDDIGGLANLKTEIQNSIGLPLRYSHLIMRKNLKRSGILLFGPPGTGKTLIAKAVATECNLSFLSVQGPELLNMYVGQSEQNVREVFAKARASAPCVVFLDELDSLAPNRGVAGDSELVVKALTKKFQLKKDLTTKKIAELIQPDVTGADLYSICSNAWLSAVRKQVKKYEDEKCNDDDMIADKIHVGLEDFKKSLTQFVSSLNQVDMEYFHKLQSSFG